MAHPRKVIRHAVVALLKGKTAAGHRVQGTRTRPHKKGRLPAIGVYTTSEPVTPESGETVPLELLRVPEVRIVVWVELSEQSDDDDAMDPVDDIAEQIEAAMDSDRYLGGEAGDSVLADTEITVDDQGDPLVAMMTMTYSFAYRTSPAPPGPLDEFLTAGVTTQIVGAGDDNAADDLVDVRAP